MSVSRETTRDLLLKAHERFDIEYGGFLSNHMTHGLMALDMLGASSERLASWFQEYIKHDVNGSQLEPAQSPGDLTIDENNWNQFKGKRESVTRSFQFLTNTCT